MKNKPSQCLEDPLKSVRPKEIRVAIICETPAKDRVLVVDDDQDKDQKLDRYLEEIICATTQRYVSTAMD